MTHGLSMIHLKPNNPCSRRYNLLASNPRKNTKLEQQEGTLVEMGSKTSHGSYAIGPFRPLGAKISPKTAEESAGIIRGPSTLPHQLCSARTSIEVLLTIAASLLFNKLEPVIVTYEGPNSKAWEIFANPIFASASSIGFCILSRGDDSALFLASDKNNLLDLTWKIPLESFTVMPLPFPSHNQPRNETKQLTIPIPSETMPSATLEIVVVEIYPSA